MKYLFIFTPASYSSVFTQLGSSSLICSLFCKKIISVVTSVFAKEFVGSLIAPKRFALFAKYSLTSLDILSIVPFVVINATTPPTLTLSNAFAKK